MSGVVVDDHLQTSAPHLYALGDAVQYAGGRVLRLRDAHHERCQSLGAHLDRQPDAGGVS